MRSVMYLLSLMVFYSIYSVGLVHAQATSSTGAGRNTTEKMQVPGSVRQNILKDELTRQNAASGSALKEQPFEKRKQMMLAHLSRVKKHLEDLKKKIERLTSLDTEITTSVNSVIDEHIVWVEQQEELVKNSTVETFKETVATISEVWSVRKDMVYFYAGLVHLNKVYVMHKRTTALYEKMLSENPQATGLSDVASSLEEARNGLEEAKKIWTTLDDEVTASELMSANNKQIKLIFQSLRSALTTMKQMKVEITPTGVTTP